MKKLLFSLIFFLTVISGVTASRYNGINNNDINNNEKNTIETVNTIKMNVPGKIRVYSNQEKPSVRISGEDSVIIKNIIYEIKDSVLNIKFKYGNWKEWNIHEDDLYFCICVDSDDPKIISSNDLILQKNPKKYYKSNHENNKN